MNDLKHFAEEAKLQGSASILPSVYYEDVIYNFINPSDHVRYVIPSSDKVKGYILAKALSSSEVFIAQVKKTLINEIWEEGRDGEPIEIDTEWTILSDNILPQYERYMLNDGSILAPNLVEDVIAELLMDPDTTFVALTSMDSACLAVLKSPMVTMGIHAGLGPDPIIRAFGDLLPSDIAIVSDRPIPEDCQAVLAYAFPHTFNESVQEQIHGNYKSVPIPDFV